MQYNMQDFITTVTLDASIKALKTYSIHVQLSLPVLGLNQNLFMEQKYNIQNVCASLNIVFHKNNIQHVTDWRYMYSIPSYKELSNHYELLTHAIHKKSQLSLFYLKKKPTDFLTLLNHHLGHALFDGTKSQSLM